MAKATENKDLATANTQLAEKKENMSERFTNMVLQEFGSNVAGALEVTDYQRRLIQGYFIAIDRALKNAEEERLRKNSKNSDHKYDNGLPVVWNNVNLTDLALDIVHYARMGLDMMQDNHLFPIPYKNNKAQKYDITLMPGYNGIQYIAEKYAVEKPLSVTIELVYDSDTFQPIKKSATNRVESYEFVINKPFDRGNVVGGFGYIEYADFAKNQLIIMTMKDIEKRKPKYASAKVWENGKQVETETDGWFEEMCIKTIKREVYVLSNIDEDNMSDSFKDSINNSEAVNNLTTRVDDAEKGLSSVRRQTAEGFAQTVTKADVISAINQTAEIIQIAAAKIALEGYVSINGTFSVDESGYMRSTGGSIGGWNILNNMILGSPTSEINSGKIVGTNIHAANLYGTQIYGSTGLYMGYDAQSGTTDLYAPYIDSNGLHAGVINSGLNERLRISNGIYTLEFSSDVGAGLSTNGNISSPTITSLQQQIISLEQRVAALEV